MLVLSIFVSFLHAHTVQALSPDAPCHRSALIDSGESWVSDGSPPLEGEFLAVNVPKAGWLAFQALALNSESTRPAWAELLSPDCGGGSLVPTAPAKYLGPGWVRVLEAGTVYLKVGAVDPSAEGGPRALHVTTHLFGIADRSLDRIYGGDGGPGSNTEEEDGEILPLTVPWGVCPAVASDRSRGSFEMLSGGDGGPGSNTEEEDGEILPLFAPGPALDAASCRVEPANGFADCAQEMIFGQTLEGDLGSASGFDQDYFAFSLASLRKIRLTLEGRGDLRLTLTDLLGRELLVRTIYGGAPAAPIKATLVPGRYFLRVEGRSAGDTGYRVELSEAGPEG